MSPEGLGVGGVTVNGRLRRAVAGALLDAAGEEGDGREAFLGRVFLMRRTSCLCQCLSMGCRGSKWILNPGGREREAWSLGLELLVLLEGLLLRRK